MTEKPSYMIESPKFEPYKPKKRRCYYSSSVLSIIFLSMFTYITIFYGFEVSPSLIFKDTKVLFFISNTLILIIAADYGAFTDKESQDCYHEYTAVASTMKIRPDNYSLIPVLRDAEIKNPKEVETKNPRVEEEEGPMVKEIICVCAPEKIGRGVDEEKPRDDIAIEKQRPVTEQTVTSEESSDARNHVMNPKAYGRSKSDKPRRKRISEGRETKRKSYDRRKSDSSIRLVVPEKWENVEEESEEFSKMSNEELNKRVEDFIQRFNRQIRSQSRVSST